MSDRDANSKIKVLEELGGELERVRPQAQAIARRRTRVLSALGTMLVVATMIGAAFTPPGRAITGEIGSWVGIGDEPTDSEHRDAVVIGTGAQADFNYEVVAERSGAGPESDHQACITIEFPDIDGLVAGSCVTPETANALAREKLTTPTIVGLPAALFPKAEVMVQGLASPAVDEVTVSYADVEGELHRVPASLDRLTEALARRIGVDAQTQSYVAFLPSDFLAPPSSPDDPLTTAQAEVALRRIQVEASANGVPISNATPSLSRAGSLAFALQAPDERFADRDDLAAQCRLELPGGADEAQIQACVLTAVEQRPKEVR